MFQLLLVTQYCATNRIQHRFSFEIKRGLYTDDNHDTLLVSEYFQLKLMLKMGTISYTFNWLSCSNIIPSGMSRNSGEGWKWVCDLTQYPLLTHWGRENMAAIFQTTFSNGTKFIEILIEIHTFWNWMKMYEFRLRFQWILFPRVQLTIFQHWLW